MEIWMDTKQELHLVREVNLDDLTDSCNWPTGVSASH